MEQNEGILETAIVSARKGREARLLRVLETRQKFKRSLAIQLLVLQTGTRRGPVSRNEK